MKTPITLTPREEREIAAAVGCTERTVRGHTRGTRKTQSTIADRIDAEIAARRSRA